MATETKEKKTRKPSGPRKTKPIYLLYRVVDGNLEVVGLTKDAFEILGKCGGNSGVSYTDVSAFVKKDKAAA